MAKKKKSKKLILLKSPLSLLAVLIGISLVAVALSFIGVKFPGTPFAQTSIRYVPDQLTMRFKPGVSGSTINSVLKTAGATIQYRMPDLNIVDAKVPPNLLGKAQTVLSNNPNVLYVERVSYMNPNATTNDTYFKSNQQSGSQSSIYKGNLGRTKVDKAWDITKGSSSVKIAILDTGVYASHPDLSGKIWGCIDGARLTKVGCSDKLTPDRYSHGTATAGIVGAATNNGKGIAGVCWNCRPFMWIMGANPTEAQMRNAVKNAADNGYRVISVSWGTYHYAKSFSDVVNYAWNTRRAVVVAAAGNDNTSRPSYPAGYGVVVSVGSTRVNSQNKDYAAGNTNYGSSVNMGAPDCMPVTNQPGTLGDPDKNGYHGGDVRGASPCGTSFAAPMVAATLQLMLSVKSCLSPSTLVSILYKTTDSMIYPNNRRFDYGRLDAQEAVSKARSASC